MKAAPEEGMLLVAITLLGQRRPDTKPDPQRDLKIRSPRTIWEII